MEFHNAVELKDFSASFFIFAVAVSKYHGATDCIKHISFYGHDENKPP